MSQSLVESMGMCPAVKLYTKTEGYDHTPSEAQIFGQVLHSMIEHTQRDPMSTLETTSEVVDLIRTHVLHDSHPNGTVEEFDVDKIRGKVVLEAMANEILVALGLWSQWWESIGGSDYNIVEIEERKYVYLGETASGKPAYAAGTPDCVIPSLVFDWKSSNRPWKEGKGLARIQGPLYVALSAEHHQAALTTGGSVQVAYVVFDRKAREWAVHEVWVNQAEADATLKAMLMWAEVVEHRAYPPQPTGELFGKSGRAWWCSAKWCSAWEVCEYKGMVPDGRDLTTKRARHW